MSDTLKSVLDSVVKEPVVYVNASAVAISMTDIEAGFKIATYVVTIITSVILCVKYIQEIRRNKRIQQFYDEKDQEPLF